MIEFENREGRLSDMPSTYAHYRLGQEVLKEIPDVSPIGNNSNRKWTLQK